MADVLVLPFLLFWVIALHALLALAFGAFVTWLYDKITKNIKRR